MAVANIFENIISAKSRIAQLTCNIIGYQTQKQLSLAEQGELGTDLANAKQDIREYYQCLYDQDIDLQDVYQSVDDIPDFCAAINKLEANYEAERNEIAHKEELIDAMMATDNTERTELNSNLNYWQTLLQDGIKSEFGSFGLK